MKEQNWRFSGLQPIGVDELMICWKCINVRRIQLTFCKHVQRKQNSYEIHSNIVNMLSQKNNEFYPLPPIDK